VSAADYLSLQRGAQADDMLSAKTGSIIDCRWE